MPYMILSMRGIIVSKQTCGQRVARHARRIQNVTMTSRRNSLFGPYSGTTRGRLTNEALNVVL